MMYEADKFGARRLDLPDVSQVLYQFPSRERLEAWIRLMRSHYTQELFSPVINWDGLTVAV